MDSGTVFEGVSPFAWKITSTFWPRTNVLLFGWFVSPLRVAVEGTATATGATGEAAGVRPVVVFDAVVDEVVEAVVFDVVVVVVLPVVVDPSAAGAVVAVVGLVAGAEVIVAAVALTIGTLTLPPVTLDMGLLLVAELLLLSSPHAARTDKDAHTSAAGTFRIRDFMRWSYVVNN